MIYETQLHYQRQEASKQMIAMLDDISDAVWTLSDKKMPPEKKERFAAAVAVVKDGLRQMPQGAAEGVVSQLTSRLMGG